MFSLTPAASHNKKSALLVSVIDAGVASASMFVANPCRFQ